MIRSGHITKQNSCLLDCDDKNIEIVFCKNIKVCSLFKIDLTKVLKIKNLPDLVIDLIFDYSSCKYCFEDIRKMSKIEEDVESGSHPKRVVKVKIFKSGKFIDQS